MIMTDTVSTDAADSLVVTLSLPPTLAQHVKGQNLGDRLNSLSGILLHLITEYSSLSFKESQIMSDTCITSTSLEDFRTQLLSLLSACRPILMDLVARWAMIPHDTLLSHLSSSSVEIMIQDEMNMKLSPNPRKRSMDECDESLDTPKNESSSVIVSQAIFHSLAYLLPIFPYLRIHAVYILQKHRLFITKIQKHLHHHYNSNSLSCLISILISLNQFIALDKATFSECVGIDTQFIMSLLSHPASKVRALAVRAMIQIHQLSDAKATALRDLYLTDSCDHILSQLDNVGFSYTKQQDFSRIISSSNPTISENECVELNILEHDYSPLTVSICGVLLPTATVYLSAGNSYATPISSPANQKDASCITVPSRAKKLKEMAFGISLGEPILVTGEPGSGKTSLIDACASKIGFDLVKIHLGDQTDSKMLLGTYVTTNEPGQFRWQPGVLVQAVMNGNWLLIEDVDQAPLEILGVLNKLLETRMLHIPSRGEYIQSKPGFRIFGTQSVSSQRSKSSSLRIGQSLWKTIVLESMPEDELQLLLNQKYPFLKSYRLTPTIIQVYHSIQDWMMQQGRMAARSRVVSLRDLIKWMSRMRPHMEYVTTDLLDDEMDTAEDVKQLSDRHYELLFRECHDCFSVLLSTPESRQLLAKLIGSALSLSGHRLDFFLNHYTPTDSSDSQQLTVGRISLPKRKHSAGEQCISRSKTFASTTASKLLLERLAVSVSQNEPVLLVGETGTGKTTVVQHLADTIGAKLIVLNMSQQADSTDLLGGFKPVDIVYLASNLRDEFDKLFKATFPIKSNKSFLDSIHRVYAKKNWNQLIVGFQNALSMAKKLEAPSSSDVKLPAVKKTKRYLSQSQRASWDAFESSVMSFKSHVEKKSSHFLFSFVEGSLVKAVRDGHWVLLDEINLASAETLECLSGLLQDSAGSLLLLEKGDIQPVPRHPQFRLFGCMNPANDAGKRDLAPALRSRFTEIWVDAPDSQRSDLLLIIRRYLFDYLPPGPTGNQIIEDVASFYIAAKKLAMDGRLFDGADQRVHISLRTLTRSLSYAVQVCPIFGIRRALYEGVFMTFLTGLGISSFSIMLQLVKQHILNTVKQSDAFLKQIPRCPGVDEDADPETFFSSNAKFTLVGHYWIQNGLHKREETHADGSTDSFVLTPSVQQNLLNLARAVMANKYPVLIQGPTSAGKTSIIEYLAKRTGHKFLRINNHEHTDLQEYLGSYVSDDNGALAFQEGVLVEALRNGYWIVLDELNLAPSDVLEALNRLLDDNRELYLPEKQETIRPHPHFMLFATQNPAGQYGGRKQLSRAFRNRFLELHFTDVPEDELCIILEKRCKIAPSYTKKLVSVYKAMQQSRGVDRVFDGKFGLITLRDLFRWASRPAISYTELAVNGFILLGERVRDEEGRLHLQSILESNLKVKFDMKEVYESLFSTVSSSLNQDIREGALLGSGIVWTKAMKRLFCLVWSCVQHGEPVLLIGETGCGKTSVFQLLSRVLKRSLRIVNAHQNSETADFLGSQRPVRSHSETDTLFEWADGPLLLAMKRGELFLIDEISLADDSVLERFNSVLEPSCLLVVAEKGSSTIEQVHGAPGFHFLATMNPGGDYGKKELSPALRNRFTEVWVPAVSDLDDISLIIQSKLAPQLVNENVHTIVLDYLVWFTTELLQKPLSTAVSLRDILAWVEFLNHTFEHLGTQFALYHGANMVLLDGLGVNHLFGTLSVVQASSMARQARQMLLQGLAIDVVVENTHNLEISPSKQFGISPFWIPLGPLLDDTSVSLLTEDTFSSSVSTTRDNCFRVLRALQLRKPILLEGSPGVGKTSLISYLARVSGHPLVRINLSEQTDLLDLFGSDLPVDGGKAGQFAWCDGPFLRAMQQGHWVLLDELNLASQQVLEGLNACLDHRSTVYIPELDRSFSCHPDFRVFAAQNPQAQGGGRKGLPKSFVNRFTQVYIQPLTSDDLDGICKASYPEIDDDQRQCMIKFNDALSREVMELFSFGRLGQPWEFNVRDVLRWMALLDTFQGSTPSDHFEMLYIQRMRTETDRKAVRKLFAQVTGDESVLKPYQPTWFLTPHSFTIGKTSYPRHNGTSLPFRPNLLQILPWQLSYLESILKSVLTKSLTLLIGPSSEGKTSMVRLISLLCGRHLEEMSLHPGVDAMELLGGFEQIDLTRRQEQLIDLVRPIMDELSQNVLHYTHPDTVQSALSLLREWSRLLEQKDASVFSSGLLQLLNNFEESKDDFAAFFSDAAYVFKILGEAVGKCRNLVLMAEAGVRGHFEWIDSSLVKALETGSWILIDNVNLCPSSVIDRLNSLFETNGNLAISECGLVDGQVRIVRPHPEFRAFMTMDAAHGEISRAMRNRAIEIFVDRNIEMNLEVQILSDALALSTYHGRPTLPFSFIHPLATSLNNFGNGFNRGSLASLQSLLVENALRGSDLNASIDTSVPTNLDLLAQNIDEAIFPVVPVVEQSHNALMSNILMHSEMLHHLIGRDEPRFYSPTFVKLNGDAIPKELLTYHAIRSYISSSSLGDNKVRSHVASMWLKNEHVSYVSASLSTLSNSQLMRRLSEYRKEIIGFSAQENMLVPLNTNLTPISTATVDKVAVVYKLWRLYCKIVLQVNTMRFSTLESSTMSIRVMTMMQLIDGVSEGFIALDQLPHPIIPTLGSILKLGSDLLIPISEHLLWSHLMSPMSLVDELEIYVDFHAYLFTLVSEHTSPYAVMESIILCIRHMQESWQLLSAALSSLPSPVYDNVEFLSQYLSSAANDLSLHKIKSISHLWTSSNTITVSTESLYVLHLQLSNLASNVGYWNLSWPERIHLTPSRRQFLYKSLQEGLATVLLMEKSDHTRNELYPVLHSLPSDMEKALHEIKDVSLQSGTDVSLSALDHVHQNMVNDILFSFCDQHILGEMMATLNSFIHLPSKEERDEVAAKVKEWELSSSLSPKQLDPWYRLMWCETPTDWEENALSIIREITNEWHHFLWKNGDIFWQALVHEQQDEKFSSLDFMNIEPAESETLSIKPVDLGSTLSVFAPMSINVLNALQSSLNAPLYSLSGVQSAIAQTRDFLVRAFIRHDRVLVDDDKLILSTLAEIVEGIVNVKVDVSSYLNPALIKSLRHCLTYIKDNLISSSFSHVTELLEQLATKQGHDDLNIRGQVWIHLALLYITHFIPSIPYDPVRAKMAQLDHTKSLTDHLASELIVESEYLWQSSGVSNNPRLNAIWEQHELLVPQIKQLSHRIPYRPQNSQSMMNELFQELCHIQHNVLGVSNVRSLIDSLSRSGDDQALEAEKSLQDVIMGAITRLETRFPAYRDLVLPITTKLFQFKYGLRLIRTFAMQQRDQSSSPTVKANPFKMLEMIDIELVSQLDDLLTKLPVENDENWEHLFETQLWILSLCSFVSCSHDESEPLIRIIGRGLDRLVKIWKICEEKKNAEKESTTSIYKILSNTIETDESKELEEFDQNFPDYFNQYDDLLPQTEEDLNHFQKEDVDASPKSAFLDTRKVHSIVQLHQTVLVSIGNNVKPSWKSHTKGVLVQHLPSLVNFLKSSQNDVGHLDLQSWPGLFSTLEAVSSELKNGSAQYKNVVFDFYNDPDIPLASQIRESLLRFEDVVCSRLTLWPEHDVLISLRGIARRIVSYSLQSPLIKFLVGLEVLIVRSHDWEAYAGREQSLSAELQTITSLIVKLRKFELDNWKNLLEVEERKFAIEAEAMWFHVYTTVTGLVEIDKIEEKNDLFRQFLENIESLLLNSPLGQFDRRMSLLHCFINHVQVLATSHKRTEGYQYVHAILSNIHQYFEQFSVAIKSALADAKKPIQKDLMDYVKIATWKDVNVFALKESAKRSHHHLNKFVKKFKESLSTPIKEIIAKQLENISHIGDMIVTSKLEELITRTRDTISAHLLSQPSSNVNTAYLPQMRRLDKTPKFSHRMRLLTQSMINGEPHDTLHVAEDIEDLSDTILARIADFQTVNREMESGSASVKGQKMLRKKALVDLFKALIEQGLSPRCSQKYAQNQDGLFVHSRSPRIPSHFDSVFQTINAELVATVQSYHFRSLGRIAMVRKLSSSEHHADITPLDAERMQSFLDNLLHIDIQSRQSLAGQAKPFSTLISWVSSIQRLPEISLIDSKAIVEGILDVLNSALFVVNRAEDILINADLLDSDLSVKFDDFKSCVERVSVLYSESCRLQNITVVSSILLQELKTSRDSLKSLKDTVAYAHNNATTLLALSTHQQTLESLTVAYENGSSLLAGLLQGDLAATEPDCDVLEAADQVVERILVAFQEINAMKYTSILSSTDASPTMKPLLMAHDRLVNTFGKPILAPIVDSLGLFLSLCHRTHVSPVFIHTCLSHIQILLQQFLNGLQFKMFEHLIFLKVTGKLTFILSNTFIELLRKGFCVQSTDDDADQNESGTEQGGGAAEGMGLAEGQGNKDISDQFDDPEQVEGLKGEQPQQPEDVGPQGDQDGLEMDNDFEDGILEDVPDRGENDENNSDAESDRDELDEQMGDLDKDMADTVDEKMWDPKDADDDDEDNKNKKDETVGEEPTAAGSQETETVAASNEEAPNDDQTAPPQDSTQSDQDKRQEDESAMDQEDEERQPINDELELERTGLQPQPLEDNADADEEGDMKEDQEMDLPDDMNLDDGSDQAQEETGELPDETIAEDVEMKDSFEDIDDDDKQGDLDLQHAQDDPQSQQNENEEDPLFSASETVEKNQSLEAESAVVGAGNASSQDDQNENQRSAHGMSTEDSPVKENELRDNQVDEQEQQNSANAEMGEEAKAKENTSKTSGTDLNPQADQPSTSETMQPKPSATNPERNLGDARKEWLSRLQQIRDPASQPESQETQHEQSSQDQIGKEFEFLAGQEEGVDATQMMHDATQEQADQMKIHDKYIQDPSNNDNEDGGNMLPDDEDDLEVLGETADEHIKSESVPDGGSKNKGKMDQVDDVEETDSRLEHKDSLAKTNDAGDNDEAVQDNSGNQDATKEDQEVSDEEQVAESFDDLTLQDYASLREDLEKRLVALRQSHPENGLSEQAAQELWKRYVHLTRDRAFSLCEHLRLILEPTLASKLRGDYATGKRLNMRKVIGYIASDFKQDKIWLRRTKPSKRTYQILLAIDDSKSMAESHSVQLAFESLALITKALTQLESGDVGILSFGEEVKLVHPFEKPFTDGEGASLLSSFTFAQERTQVRQMIEQSIAMLEERRYSGSHGSEELWQLQLIISDGICEDHDIIRSLVRRAAEERIIVVFIVLDNRGDAASILKMTNVTYSVDPKTLKPSVQLNRYMDTFPFDYFVIVKDMDRLPAVLADTLRQFFALMAQ